MAPFTHGSETGVREIDAGNEGLRYLLQRVFEPGVECKRDCNGYCDRTDCTKIEAILRYVRRNFSGQEKVMAEAGYPIRADHQEDHRALVDELRAMQKAKLCADLEQDAVRAFVEVWSGGHFLNWDRPLGRWTLTRRVLDPTG